MAPACRRNQGHGSFFCLSTVDMPHMEGHIVALQLVDDVKKLYSVSAYGTIREWANDLSTCNLLFSSPTTPVKAFAMSEDQRMFTAHHDNKVRVWSCGPTKITKLATLPTVRDYVANMLSADNFVEVRRGQTKRLWMEHVDCVTALAFGMSGDVLYSGSWDKSVKVWDTSNFKCLESFKAHHDAINAMVVGRVDGGLLYTASADSSIKVWKRMKKHEMVTHFKAHEAAVNAVALEESGDSCFLYSGGSEGSVKVWRWKKGMESMWCEEALHGHRQAVLCINAVAKREGGDETTRVVVSGSADKTIRIWKRGIKAEKHSCVGVLDGHRGPIRCVVASFTWCRVKNMDGLVIYGGSLDSLKSWFLIDDTAEDTT